MSRCVCGRSGGEREWRGVLGRMGDNVRWNVLVFEFNGGWE